MADFLAFLYDVLKIFFGGIWRSIKNFFLGIWDTINLSSYFMKFEDYRKQFGVGEYILSILVLIFLICLIVAILLLIIVFVRRQIKVKRQSEKTESLLNEINMLNAEVIKLRRDRSKFLQANPDFQLSDVDVNMGTSAGSGSMNKNSQVDTSKSRFSKLLGVDEYYQTFDQSTLPYNHDIKLDEICERFRNFACSRMHLYYDIRVIRLYVAALSSTRLIILQGISGTGKTSLPYAWGKFLQNETQIAAVQPSWRDRTELFGYFNEFTKRFNETEVLKRMYEARYTNQVYFTILDEMNIARVEYYFAEMLSLLEMPSKDEWVIDIVPSGWESDPKLIKNGRFKIPENMWYIGTANNDDSTFAISDKVYDRAIPINIDSKGVPFDAPDTEPCILDYQDMERMFAEARENNKVSEENLAKIEQLDNYVIEHFRIAFGNRIVKQLREFVPSYVACGGSEVDGLDYVLTNKIFRKFEGLNLSFIRDEIDGLVDYLSDLWGEENMQEAKAYLARLKKLV